MGVGRIAQHLRAHIPLMEDQSPITHTRHFTTTCNQSSGWIWYLWPLSAPTLTYLPSYIHITRNTKNPLKKIWVNLGIYTWVCFLHEFKEEKNKKDKVTLLSQILLKSKSYMSPSTTCKEIFPVQQWNWSQSIVLPTRLGFYVWGMGCFHFPFCIVWFGLMDWMVWRDYSIVIEL